MRGALVAILGAVALLGAACSDEPLADTSPPRTTTSAPTIPTPTTPPPTTSTPAGSPTPEPARFDVDRAVAHVRHLAGAIGPRLATGPAFREAAAYVEDQLADHGYDVRRQAFPVPAGDSWGVPVEAGRSFNVVAAPPDFDAGAPYRLVGAHLDTVAVAPGAEDNASGIAVLLEVARILQGRGQVVLVAFGAEEPVGPGELHHFGSKHYVAQLSGDERRNLRAMVSLDRVGVGGTVPLASITGGPTRVRDDLARTAEQLRIPAVVGLNEASDHESFADAGIPAARVGSTPYAAYHSAADLPSVIQPDQLQRVGRLVTAWLRDR